MAPGASPLVNGRWSCVSGAPRRQTPVDPLAAPVNREIQARQRLADHRSIYRSLDKGRTFRIVRDLRVTLGKVIAARTAIERALRRSSSGRRRVHRPLIYEIRQKILRFLLT
jgi:hypothetical protein